MDPLFIRTEEDIRAALDAWVNQGVDATDPSFVDTRQGSMFYICTQPVVIELARMWDALGNEVAAAAYIPTAWGDALDAGAAEFGIERKVAVAAVGIETFNGAEGTLIGTGTRVSPAQSDPNVDPPVFEVTESGTIDSGLTIDLPIRALEEGIVGNVSAHAVTVTVDPVPGLTSIDNAAPIAGGADVEDDEGLRARVIAEIAYGRGQGNIGDYIRWALSVPGVGRVSVVPIWNGPGTVLVVVMDATGGPVGVSIVQAVQDFLDPVPGQGAGQASIDHTVTVQTPAAVPIDVVATVIPESGSTVAGLQDDITAAVTSYINLLGAGQDVIYNHVRAQFFEVEGVHDVSALTLNAATNDVFISESPIQVARMGDITLS